MLALMPVASNITKTGATLGTNPVVMQKDCRNTGKIATDAVHAGLPPRMLKHPVMPLPVTLHDLGPFRSQRSLDGGPVEQRSAGRPLS